LIQHSSFFIGEEEVQTLNDVLSSGLITKGRENELFKSEFGELLKANYVKITSSGTMAFFLILKAIGVEKGDDVLLPDYICSDLLGPIKAVGANAVLYDNSSDSYLSREDEILPKVTNKTKVIVVNHTFGFINKCFETLYHQLPKSIALVEDCCHLILPNEMNTNGHTRKYSSCCFYSFNATKLIATGEGGAITTNNEQLFNKLESFKIAENLSDLNCALGRIQLRKLNFFIKRRIEIAQEYMKEFNGYLSNDFYNNSGIFFRFPLTVNKPEKFWTSGKVAYRKGVDSLVSDHLGVKSMLYAGTMLATTVSIPIYPMLKDEDVELIIKETKKHLK
jgi:dTDP-4-amino-4,6-dideoxygalactose transaminase